MPIALLPLRRKMDLEVLQTCCRKHWGISWGKKEGEEHPSHGF